MYVFSIWNIHKHQVTQFIELANKHHQTIKFTAQISYTKITFLDLNVFKGERFAEKSILDIEHFSIRISQAANPLGIKKGFIKGEALRLLRTNSSENEFKTKISHSLVLWNDDTQKALLPLHSQISNLRTGNKPSYRNANNISEYCPSSHNTALRCIQKWHLIQQQPLLSEVFQDPPIASYKRGRSLKYTPLSWLKHVDRSCVGLSPSLISPL